MQYVIAGAAAALIVAGTLHLAGILPGPEPDGAADRYGFSVEDHPRDRDRAEGGPGARSVR